ncbi:MAG: peptide chain release factor 1 [Chloroflexi bacterium]|nr:peptide chain release factor 1 [Chloroflexota bacterium]
MPESTTIENRLRASLQAAAERQTELETQMSQPDVASDRLKMQRLGREYSRISVLVRLRDEFDAVLEEIADAQTILAEETDDEMLEMARDITRDQQARHDELIDEIQIALIPRDETDDADAVLEIRAGTGGDEAGLFANELYRMYQRFAELHGWKTSVLSLNDTGIGGLKEVVFEIEGEGAYPRLKHESGTHRVQRVPQTESQGRIHTSAATVAVLPKAEDIDVHIDDKDLKIDIFHAGGHGGQNVNKVATAVRITHEPSGIVAQCQNERSQLQNKMQAMDILRARLWDMELRRRASEQAANRKAQVGSGDRSEKIRTYNFPQSRVTDHRINLTSHNLPKILDGEIDEFVDALQQVEQTRKIQAASAT